MPHHVCPWYIGYFLLAPWRRLFHNPEKVLRPFVKEGMTVLDIGSGMGYFSLPMARAVGANRKVICVDLQEKMVRGLERRAKKAGLSDRIDARICPKDGLGIDDLEGRVDFALLFAVVHEVPDRERLFAEVHKAMKRGALLLVAEPKGHVSREQFGETVAAAGGAGFEAADNPRVPLSRAVLMRKT